MPQTDLWNLEEGQRVVSRKTVRIDVPNFGMAGMTKGTVGVVTLEGGSACGPRGCESVRRVVISFDEADEFSAVPDGFWDSPEFVFNLDSRVIQEENNRFRDLWAALDPDDFDFSDDYAEDDYAEDACEGEWGEMQRPYVHLHVPEINVTPSIAMTQNSGVAVRLMGLLVGIVNLILLPLIAALGIQSYLLWNGGVMEGADLVERVEMIRTASWASLSMGFLLVFNLVSWRFWSSSKRDLRKDRGVEGRYIPGKLRGLGD